MIEQPSLSELRAFAAIVTHRSFRKAADELGVSPSTLSHIMRNLETSLDVRLLVARRSGLENASIRTGKCSRGK